MTAHRTHARRDATRRDAVAKYYLLPDDVNCLYVVVYYCDLADRPEWAKVQQTLDGALDRLAKQLLHARGGGA